MSQPPYIITERIVIDKKYNPEYGDNRMCECGHKYYRHFDTYEDMYACGCKYCPCYEFVETGPYSLIDHYYCYSEDTNFQIHYIPTGGPAP